MTTQTLSITQVAALPRVNLLPPEIADRRRARKLQVGMGAAVALAVVGVAFGYVLAHSSVNHAKADLAAAQAQNSALEQQKAQYAGDAALRAQLTAEQTMLATAMGPEIQWSHYLNDLTLRIPDNVWITSLSAAEGGNSQATPANNSTAATSGSVGTVTFAGTAFSHDDVATWLDSLAKEKGYANAYFTNSTEAFIGPRKVVNFSSTATVTTDALSGRYTRQPGN